MVLTLVCVAAGSANAQTVARDDASLRSQVKAAFAQTAQPARPAATAQSSRPLRLSPPAGLTLLSPADARHAAAPVPAQGKKSFFKTPWPYVIIAVVVVAVVAVAASGGSGGGY
jgi:hypothetical protein